jgi:pimeloyl-ACP methyl ester carboxylesterase
MAAEIPGARLAVLEGAGHISNIEAPGRFNAALAAFLAEPALRAAA